MSPAIDMLLSRWEAMASLLTLLALVMGVGALPEETGADDLPRGKYCISGVMVAHDADHEMHAMISIHDGTVTFAGFREDKRQPVTIEAAHPSARRFVNEMATQLQGIAIHS